MSHSSSSRSRQATADTDSRKILERLTSDNLKKQKSALIDIILNMSKEEDHGVYFFDVIQLISTTDMELKKLVCLYIVSTCQENSEKVMIAVNILKQDSSSHDPLTRALAIKTMGGMRIKSIITEFISCLLTRVKNDDDPYVRKCAVLCVAKFYATDPEQVRESGLIEETINCLNHPNAMVISNAIIALNEISQMSGKSVFPAVTSERLKKLCACMIETTEWGQIVILDFLSTLEINSEDSNIVLEDISSFLTHTNSAVVMSAVKVFVSYSLRHEEVKKKNLASIVGPLSGLLNSCPEILYLILRNISLIVQEFPDLMVGEVHSFVPSSNEPHCVRMEKIDIMTRLVTDENINTVLSELNTYAQETDAEIVKKAIISIGKCSIKVANKAAQCVSCIKEFIERDPENSVDVALLVMKDIFRQYPDDYTSLISLFVENVIYIREPESRSVLVWLLGEFPHCFQDVCGFFHSYFLESYLVEPLEVQLQILTAGIKIYVFNPQENKDILTNLLDITIKNCLNPDLRDRAIMYSRLISSADISVVKKIVCSKNPQLDYQTDDLDPKLRRELLRNMCTLASVFHRSPHTFIEEVNESTFANNAPRFDAATLDDFEENVNDIAEIDEMYDVNTAGGAEESFFAGSSSMETNQFAQNLDAATTTSLSDGFASMVFGNGPDTRNNWPSFTPQTGFNSEFGAVNAFNPSNQASFSATAGTMNTGSNAASFGGMDSAMYAPLGASSQVGQNPFGGNVSSSQQQSSTFNPGSPFTASSQPFGFSSSPGFGTSVTSSSSFPSSGAPNFGSVPIPVSSSTFVSFTDPSANYSLDFSGSVPNVNQNFGFGSTQSGSAGGSFFPSPQLGTSVVSSFPQGSMVAMHQINASVPLQIVGNIQKIYESSFSLKMVVKNTGTLPVESIKFSVEQNTSGFFSTPSFGSMSPGEVFIDRLLPMNETNIELPLSFVAGTSSFSIHDKSFNLLPVKCAYGNGHSLPLMLQIPLNFLAKPTVTFMPDKFKYSQPTSSKFISLFSSADEIRARMAKMGLLQISSPNDSHLLFGCSLFNGIDAMIVANFQPATKQAICQIYSDSSYLCVEIASMISRE